LRSRQRNIAVFTAQRPKQFSVSIYLYAALMLAFLCFGFTMSQFDAHRVYLATIAAISSSFSVTANPCSQPFGPIFFVRRLPALRRRFLF
jgi:hypothetical protein